MGKRKRKASSQAPKKTEKKPRKSSCESNGEMRLGVSKLFQEVQQTLSKRSNPANAVAMEKYMRDQFEFLGIKSPDRKLITKDFVKEKLGHSETRELVKLLWELPHREYQYFAIDFLDKNIQSLGESSKELESNFDFIEYLVTTKSWWDTVDAIASHLVGFLVKKHPEQGKLVMEKWINHENMWMRRTALLHQLQYKHDTNEDTLYKFCLLRTEENEFFIQKAMGWALRQYAHTNPSSVKSFLVKNKTSVSKLTYREAAKHLDV